MNDDEQKLMKTGMEVVLKPITDIVADVAGLAGGDWLRNKRERNRKKLQEETAEELKRKNVKAPTEPSPSIALPLLAAAQDESREEMVKLWAKLLAAAMNPAKVGHFRRSYIELLQRLEPIDALILKSHLKVNKQGTTAAKALASELKLDLNEVLVSFQSLIDLGLATRETDSQTVHMEHTHITPMGSELDWHFFRNY
jgi:hypothetical protein